jgi:hypothetical protein
MSTLVVQLRIPQLNSADSNGRTIRAVARPEPVVVPLDGRATLTGRFAAEEHKTYRVLPFVVPPGTARLEVGYRWTPEPETVLDLGLWDTAGYRAVEGFRGWSGSREGRAHRGEEPIWVEAGSAARCYRPGAIEPGTWWAELGVGDVGPDGASYEVAVTARSTGSGGRRPRPDPVDPDHIARAGPGWYHADLHQHGRHSHPRAPDWDELVSRSRAAGLDVLPIVDYVTPWHWAELGAVQRANPDLLVFPGREVITYFGHAVVLGETPGLVEYRHGFEDVDLGAIQRDAVAAGAVFQVAHPTSYPEALFGNHCRGCEFTLDDRIDWDQVTSIEVLTGPVLLGEPPDYPNPFVATALDRWRARLAAGHRLTAVSGSDDKLGPGYGSSATALWCRELSRRGVVESLRSGHAYVRTRGAHHSPALEVRCGDARMGDTVVGPGELEVTVAGGAGQTLVLLRDGVVEHTAEVGGDEVTWRTGIEPDPASGPLGTAWEVQTVDEHAPTTIANPVFCRAGP